MRGSTSLVALRPLPLPPYVALWSFSRGSDERAHPGSSDQPDMSGPRPFPLRRRAGIEMPDFVRTP